MRRYLRAVAGAVMLAAFLTGATVSSASNPAKGADIKGVGAGKTLEGTFEFDLSAHLRPDGTAFGHVREQITTSIGTASVWVDVSCLSVRDSGKARAAVLFGRVTKVEPQPNAYNVTVGDPRAYALTDGGEPSSGVPVDGFLPISPAFACSHPFMRASNVEQGNIVIKAG